MPTKDFSKSRDDISFTLEDDTFHAYPGIAAGVLVSYVSKVNTAILSAQSAGGVEAQSAGGVEAQYEACREVMELCLLKESYARFQERLDDNTQPIDLGQINDIAMWLFEQYGLRPTQPSDNSSDGQSSPESGTSSTESTQGEVSISANSPSTDS
jgi:hypothetical protein